MFPLKQKMAEKQEDTLRVAMDLMNMMEEVFLKHKAEINKETREELNLSPGYSKMHENLHTVAETSSGFQPPHVLAL